MYKRILFQLSITLCVLLAITSCERGYLSPKLNISDAKIDYAYYNLVDETLYNQTVTLLYLNFGVNKSYNVFLELEYDYFVKNNISLPMLSGHDKDNRHIWSFYFDNYKYIPDFSINNVNASISYDGRYGTYGSLSVAETGANDTTLIFNISGEVFHKYYNKHINVDEDDEYDAEAQDDRASVSFDLRNCTFVRDKTLGVSRKM